MPIGCMCILVVLGIWMPVSSGETIGFQVTMLLTMIVYLDVLSSSVPNFEDVSIAPRLLIMFMIIAIGSVLAHVIISEFDPVLNLFKINLAMNLWCHDKSSDRVFTFDKFRAKLAYRCAKFFQIFKNGEYNIPKVVKNFVNGEENDEDDEESFKEAWVFYGKMISHFWGIILSFSIMLALIAILIDLHVESAHAIKNIF